MLEYAQLLVDEHQSWDSIVLRQRVQFSFLVVSKFGLRLQLMFFQIVLWVIVAILCIPLLVALYWFVVQRNR